MRILRIESEGIFLFEGKAVIDFNAEQRVYPDNAASFIIHLGILIQIMFYHLLVLMHPEKRPPLN